MGQFLKIHITHLSLRARIVTLLRMKLEIAHSCGILSGSHCDNPKIRDQRSNSLRQISRRQEDVPRCDVSVCQLGAIGIAFLEMLPSLLTRLISLVFPTFFSASCIHCLILVVGLGVYSHVIFIFNGHL